ncbi:MAG: alpha/beta hydrolase [Bacteroidales bacterium]|jgi:acetyl esterase/lipase|nr:alpha/beta hydrolase [Bacteroidales bacterium]
MKKLKKIMLPLLFIGIILSSCGKPNGNSLMNDVPYGKHKNQTMDIALPSEANDENRVPVVLCIHGGSWSNGDKHDFDFVKERTLKSHCAYVTINYRMIGDNVTYKEMLADIKKAVGYLKDHAKEYPIKTDRMVVLGSSAGGHLSLLYAYSQDSPIPVKVAVGMCAPTDFTDPEFILLNAASHLPLMNKLLGTNVSVSDLTNPNFVLPAQVTDASPVFHVKSTTPPTVLAHGLLDPVVTYSNAVRLDQKLTDFNIEHQLISYPNSGHELNKDPEQSNLFWNTVLQYVNENVME